MGHLHRHPPHPDQVSVDIVHHKTLYELHAKVNPKEIIVGWYERGSETLYAIAGTSSVKGSFGTISSALACGTYGLPMHLNLLVVGHHLPTSCSSYV